MMTRSEAPGAGTFPRRDRDGRVCSVTELLVAVAVGWLLGLVALVLVDGVVTLLGLGPFGRISGWLAATLPVWLFIEEVRAWRPFPVRYPLALGSALLVLVTGVALATIVSAWLPPLGSGAAGAAVASACYAVLWFHGVRWLASRQSQR